MERPTVQKVDSSRFDAEGPLPMKRQIVNWGENRLSHTPRGMDAQRIHASMHESPNDNEAPRFAIFEVLKVLENVEKVFWCFLDALAN